MQFTTKVPIAKSVFPISYDSKILSLGSCFAENMSEKFDYFKFQNANNPFGIIFNPVSIEKLINRSLRKEYFTENDIFFHNDLWHCFEVHSELSHPDKMIFLENLNRIIEQANSQIINSTHFILTLGTSWVYRSIQTGEIVANCHKVPQKQFTKELLSVEVISQSLQNIIAEILKVNPEIKFIFTISPVRHIKDGFVENQLSKAHLITVIHNSQFTIHSYFPSFEIMMDELRDYRFYAPDMLHPNDLAVDYIWERFQETCISEESYKMMDEVSTIQKGLAHRPFNPDTESHKKFVANLNRKIERLQKQMPFIIFK